MALEMSLGHLAALACQLECSAPKVGNVHRGADFDDTSFYHFLVSGNLLGNIVDQHPKAQVGELVLRILEVTAAEIGTNTNLGIALLLAPMIVAVRKNPSAQLKREHVSHVLKNLSHEDSSQIYQAIRTARPGGLGSVNDGDVHSIESMPILKAMELAEERDLIAAEWVHGFPRTFDFVVPHLIESTVRWNSLVHAIVETHVRIIARFGDSLIGRKLGPSAQQQAQAMAESCLTTLDDPATFWRGISELDFWMRADGRRRNPGTSADLIVAGLFIALIRNELELANHLNP
jgi:triphosphoribosyl-dephospho-CoA synthase